MLQGARLVDIALEDGSAWSGDGFNHIKPSFADNTVHFIGLLSDGGAPLAACRPRLCAHPMFAA